VAAWGGFNWSLEVANTEEFCLSCHEMEGNVFNELQESVHYTNRTGVRATCPDCHVPSEWKHKVSHKITATIKELQSKWKGTIDTSEKFEQHRLRMAMSEWSRMKLNDSLECRNCHDKMSMDFAKQEPRSSERHEAAFVDGKTCIECHKGIAHRLPKDWKQAAKEAGLQP
ncbi:MAG: NapC/NirT family cytochrome c, partial [Candidatus Thiodiazotropha sp. (ex Lucinoma annulata)]|nr:NapC/NirT family cytochrome c [Candidatus Thiodiazotropha sp. (ex Lucinoma annulata)]